MHVVFVLFSFLLTLCSLRRRVAEDNGTVSGLYAHRAFDELASCWEMRFGGHWSIRFLLLCSWIPLSILVVGFRGVASCGWKAVQLLPPFLQ
jgi:hypothetical protein